MNRKKANQKKILKKHDSKKTTHSSIIFRRLFLARPNVLHQYLPHQSINQYLYYVKNRWPAFVKLHTLGVSYEGREIKAIEIDKTTTICRPKSNQAYRWNPKVKDAGELSPSMMAEKRNIIFIEGGTHGREWLSISVALHIVHQLTEKHISNRSILKRLRFFIVPISNPDGYEFSLRNNLRWRKNRRPTSPGSKHVGIDCNRNFDFNWDNGSTKTSDCTYKGEKPFSECETRALSDALHMFKPNILLFMSLHSYAQAISYPWGYTKKPPENLKELQAIASAGSHAIRAFSGRLYRTCSVVKLNSQTISGSIVDYAYGVINVPFAFVMELPESSYGFQPPADFIRPIGQESWIGIREMCFCAYALHANRPPNVSLLDKMREKYSRPFTLAKKLLYSSENSKMLLGSGKLLPTSF